MIPVDFVQQELRTLPGARVGAKLTFILCPFHPEKTASGRVSHDASKNGVGSFKCYGCGAKAKWNELAGMLNLTPYGKGATKLAELSVPPVREEFYEASLLPEEEKQDNDFTTFALSDKAIAKVGLKNGEWRGYPIPFLRDVIKADLVYFDWSRKFLLRLPVNIHGKMKGYIRAELFKPSDKKTPSYLNKSGSWSLTHGLFPFDPAVALMKELKLSTMVIVEGPRDALRLVSNGIPAMSMLGTQSWSDQKSRLLEFAGVTRLVCLMDGDDAGKNATRFLRTGLRNKDSNEASIRPLPDTFEWKEIHLWDVKIPTDHSESKLDPGNMPDKFLKTLKKILS